MIPQTARKAPKVGNERAKSEPRMTTRFAADLDLVKEPFVKTTPQKTLSISLRRLMVVAILPFFAFMLVSIAWNSQSRSVFPQYKTRLELRRSDVTRSTVLDNKVDGPNQQQLKGILLNRLNSNMVKSIAVEIGLAIVFQAVGVNGVGMLASFCLSTAQKLKVSGKIPLLLSRLKFLKLPKNVIKAGTSALKSVKRLTMQPHNSIHTESSSSEHHPH
eukprot:scaffold26866_cov52-Attheya_sp.AAC.4